MRLPKSIVGLGQTRGFGSILPPMLGDRSTFPNLAYDIYFNHAAMTPVSKPVREAMVETMASYERMIVIKKWELQQQAEKRSGENAK